MKMDVMSEISNGDSNSQNQTPGATDIGREFVRQYYTILSEAPSNVHRFYSHESVFTHNEVTAVGQAKIQKAIEVLQFIECKVRIHSIKGAATLGQGIALQVCGEMSQDSQPSRRFVQTFVLCQQTPKKFFVQNDIFQFIDQGFAETIEPPRATQAPKVIAAAAPAKLNGHTNAPAKVEQPAPPAQPVAPPQKAEISPTKPVVEHAPPKPKEQPKKVEPVLPAPPVDNEPKTWAKLVGGGSTATVVHAPPPSKPAPLKHTAHPPTNNNQAPTQNGTNDRNHKREERPGPGTKLYLGGITRNIIPSDEIAVAAEIKEFLSRIADVEHVHVPRKVCMPPESENHKVTGFAFVTMKTTNDVKKMFNACRTDDTHAHLLPIELKQFDFKGDASLSMSEIPARGGFRGGPRNGRGSFGPRGGRGGRGTYHSTN